MSESTRNIIAENVFSQNGYGIILGIYCTWHTIRNNAFRDNQNGLFLNDATDNDILKNNFINNGRDAFFHSYFSNAFCNRWYRNY